MAENKSKNAEKTELKLTLRDEPLFASATSRFPGKKITGDFYYYDGIRVNGRTRICQKANERGMFPASAYTLGWVCK